MTGKKKPKLLKRNRNDKIQGDITMPRFKYSCTFNTNSKTECTVLVLTSALSHLHQNVVITNKCTQRRNFRKYEKLNYATVLLIKN